MCEEAASLIFNIEHLLATAQANIARAVAMFMIMTDQLTCDLASTGHV
jgi:hypothetical protein